MEKTKYDVFISYSRNDYVDENGNVIPDNEVLKILDALKQSGITFWFDQKGIVHGEDFGEKILKYIKVAKVFVYLSTKEANKSIWTRKEIACALMYKKKIIPVRIDESPYDDSVMFRIADLEHINYYLNPKKSRDELVDSVKRYLLEEQRKLEEEDRQRHQQEELRRRQQQANELRTEISMTEKECTDLEKMLLQKQHDLSEVSHELESKRNNLEEQKRQLNAILFEATQDAQTSEVLLSGLSSKDDDGYKFNWKHPIDSLGDMYDRIKYIINQRHWIVNITLLLYLILFVVAIVKEFHLNYYNLGLCSIYVLGIYALFQLLLNKRAGIGLLLLTPVLELVLAYLYDKEHLYMLLVNNTYFNDNQVLLRILYYLIVVLIFPILFIRKNGKSAYSQLNGRVYHALNINLFPCYYILFVLFFVVSCIYFNHEIHACKININNSIKYHQLVANQRDNLIADFDTIDSLVTVVDFKTDSLFEQGEKYFKMKQYGEAVRCYHLASIYGVGEKCPKYIRLAQYKLGKCYEKGLGVVTDTTKALRWYNIAKMNYFTPGYWDDDDYYHSSESGSLPEAQEVYNRLSKNR